MRIKLTLRPTNQHCSLPFNYQYPLSIAIYKILQQSSSEYSEFLHNHGYLGLDGKPRKLFTFSKLFILPKRRQTGSFIRIAPQSRVILYVSSPMLADFVQHFVIGLFGNQQMEIAGPKAKSILYIEQVETIPDPEFTSPCYFKMLSPVVVSTQFDTPNGLRTHYYRPLEGQLSEAVRESLIRKHETAYGKPPQDTELVFKVDQKYVAKKGGPEKISKLITIREGRADATKIKAFESYFTLDGSTELMHTAWECGLWDKCSMGFGCVGVVGETRPKVSKTFEV